jgi:uncharacterized protein
MSPRVVAGIKRLLTERAPGLDDLSIAWFGGEPLLAPDIVEEIQSHALSLSECRPGMTFSASMTTNGFLLDDRRFAHLWDLGIRDYQISFDGPRDWHDRQRKRRGGQGSFDRIWSNLVALGRTDLEFRVLVRVHVNSENERAMPGFVASLRDAFGGDPRFELFIRKLSRLGGDDDSALPVQDGAEVEQAVDDLRNQARESGLSTFAPGESCNVCYAARGNSFVVRANGDLAKCTVALSSPENRVGRLSEAGRLELDSVKMGGWLRGLFSGDAKQLRCPRNGYAQPSPPG